MVNAGLLYDPRISNFGWFGLNCPADYKVTAASTPDYDVWGPDGCKWSAQDWINWHKAMVTAYGKPTADDKWAMAYDKSSYGASEIGYSTGNPDFKEYVLAQNLQKKSTILSKVYKAEGTLNALGEPIRNVGQTITNITETAANTAGAASQIASWLPWIVVGAMAIVAYLVITKKSLNVI